MPIKIGNTAMKLPDGIAKVMVGNNLVYQKTGAVYPSGNLTYADSVVAYNGTLRSIAYYNNHFFVCNIDNSVILTYSITFNPFSITEIDDLGQPASRTITRGMIAYGDTLFGVAASLAQVVKAAINSSTLALTYDLSFAQSVIQSPVGLAIANDKVYSSSSAVGGIEVHQINQDGTFSYISGFDIDTSSLDSLPGGMIVVGNKLFMIGRSTGRIFRFTVNQDGSLTYDNYYVQTTVASPYDITADENHIYVLSASNSEIARFTNL